MKAVRMLLKSHSLRRSQKLYRADLRRKIGISGVQGVYGKLAPGRPSHDNGVKRMRVGAGLIAGNGKVKNIA